MSQNTLEALNLEGLKRVAWTLSGLMADFVEEMGKKR